ncbi:MAG: ABC transporter ATP-binding protein [Treponema sp.]|nr:ABC transporter ATP-binding protein [Treponema sp.]
MAGEENEYAIEMVGITKKFPGVVANDNVTLKVKKNEVLALLGENGAGKSTLMSVLFGSYDPDAGYIKINGRQVKIKNPNDATALGIGMVHQHFKLVRNYTVTENIVLGMESTSRFGLLDLKTSRQKVKELSEKYHLNVNPDEKIEDITVGMQQRVEILKVLYRNADIIILDEPTAVLTPQEIDELMEIIRKLKAEGKTIILITHKLKEIKAVAQRCTILRRGKYIDTVDVDKVTEDELAQLMVGRSVNLNINKKPCNPGEVILKVENLTVNNTRGLKAVDNLSLEVRSGEILGIAGVDGNGQKELIYAITGLCEIESGTIQINGRHVENMTIRQRIHEGLAHVPEDRHLHGLVNDFNVAENSGLKTYHNLKISPLNLLIDKITMHNMGENYIQNFDIRAGEGALTTAGSMSGGNQQKLIIAREIGLGSKLIIFCQPTRGLDVGAIEYIRKRIVEERDKGVAVLLVSYELDEIMNLCDRIATISGGRIVGISNAGEVTEKEIGLMMAGETLGSKEESV